MSENKQAKSFSVDTGVTDPKISREWIDQILNAKIQPRLASVRIDEINLGNGHAIIITVPQTQTGPHQAPDMKYYKRFELQSVPMADYEIRDILNRATTPELRMGLLFEKGIAHSLTFERNTEVSRPVNLYATISNESKQPAFYTQVTIGIDARLRRDLRRPRQRQKSHCLASHS